MECIRYAIIFFGSNIDRLINFCNSADVTNMHKEVMRVRTSPIIQCTSVK